MTQPSAERIGKEIDELVSLSERLSRDASSASAALGSERIAELSSLVARGGQLIRRLYGASSQYQNSLDRVLKIANFSTMHSNWHGHVAELAGILKGIQSDIRTGMVDDFRALAQAEIFADFLEMSEHLLDTGYKDAAAVLLGAVLEDSLRKLAVRTNISTTQPNGRPLTIDPLNVALARDGVYSPLIQKQIMSWANLRNDAAHGNFAKYDSEQVRQMLLFLQKFCSDHLK